MLSCISLEMVVGRKGLTGEVADFALLQFEAPPPSQIESSSEIHELWRASTHVRGLDRLNCDALALLWAMVVLPC